MLQLPQSVKISAYLLFALAALNLLGTCGVAVFFGLQLSEGATDEGSAFIGLSVGLCLTLLFAVLNGVTGYGLLKLQSWARIAAIVLAILSLCSFPIGTILGGIILYFMFQQETTQAFA